MTVFCVGVKAQVVSKAAQVRQFLAEAGTNRRSVVVPKATEFVTQETVHDSGKPAEAGTL